MLLIKWIPNLLTFTNLILGFCAIQLTMLEEYYPAVMLIVTAMFIDYLDGGLAKYLHVESSFGKELDSLSDLVSFGVAPALLSWSVVTFSPHWLGFGLVIFPLAGAYRLARFNQKGGKQSYFMGFPITTAGGLLALASLYSGVFSFFIFYLIMLMLSLLMVSRIPFYSFNKIKTERFKYLVISMVVLLLLAYFFPIIIVIFLSIYLSISIISSLLLYTKK